jgi:hypothetical protein
VNFCTIARKFSGSVVTCLGAKILTIRTIGLCRLAPDADAVDFAMESADLRIGPVELAAAAAALRDRLIELCRGPISSRREIGDST